MGCTTRSSEDATVELTTAELMTDARYQLSSRSHHAFRLFSTPSPLWVTFSPLQIE
jgi:hypothetical protein